ncbi:GIY-YIG nuclease family protein [Vibrio lentus]|uniref:GIY-YIG domain-containing protein n=1 Tax=Vibrio lentus TaxID=136468 RepID=A0AA45A7J9_9VIBR|nr:GIY-YIG nuclease family protein [Vibrio lentus]MCB5361177.1 GIY-YIG nuclease family protein [Vibrio lentus]MCB5451601.1 GIY-YIG nuclease family protein [Vibrio lentus]MCB5462912.1 GIY-YIG nuclease family protein [Vibrio lentus]MCC4794165.1 GIY-YIG nuclease family protein [Vibrio lentus]MCC4850466.1 GIY-YIG nuclease family protein [Vibrio lentus]
MSILDKNAGWVVYLIRNRHNALYCGVTNNLERRFEQHQTGKGAKALKGKGPLELVWSFDVRSKSEALKTEYAIKQLPKLRKEKLVSLKLIIEWQEDQIQYIEVS